LFSYIVSPYLSDSTDRDISDIATDFIAAIFSDSTDIIGKFQNTVKFILNIRPIRAFNKGDELAIIQQFCTYA
jgi:hypothetical protein